MHFSIKILFFCKRNDAEKHLYLFRAEAVGAFGTCGKPLPEQEKKSRKCAENEWRQGNTENQWHKLCFLGTTNRGNTKRKEYA